MLNVQQPGHDPAPAHLLLLLAALLLSACARAPASSGRVAEADAAGHNAVSAETVEQQAERLPALSDALPDGPSGNLADDTLYPPAQVRLSIMGEPGTLLLEWTPIDSQKSVRVFHYDSLTGEETLVYESTDHEASRFRVHSRTHLTAWHHERLRVELCSFDDCVSSPRMTLQGLANQTITQLRPAVYITGERFAEHVTITRNATLSVSTLPVEGALDLHLRVDNDWIYLQRLTLTGLSASPARSMMSATDADGDTIAVLIRERRRSQERQIRILQRLGETWIETARWPVAPRPAAPAAKSAALPEALDPRRPGIDKLTLSHDGSRLLLHAGEILVSYHDTGNGWSAGAGFENSTETLAPASLEVLSGESTAVASAGNSSLSRVFTLHEESGQIFLSAWMQTDPASDWNRINRFPLEGFDALADLDITSDAGGDALLVAGWEPSSLSWRTPVLWHYRVHEAAENGTDNSTRNVSVLNSLRAAPTLRMDARLILRADDTLGTVVLGWQAEGDASSGVLPDAAIGTFSYHDARRAWRSALELPEDLPVLAKQAFAGDIALSGDASTLMMGIPAGQGASIDNRVGELLVLR
ncbi:MAG: hypothetical protein HKN42_08855 [Granulosicoccus sp.]|nr:hypothetical protein [Granulosicoccus sp.]